MTIEAIAKLAGVTKGGVQYHFASKDQLIVDLLEHALASFEALLPAQPGPEWLLAYIDATALESEFDAAIVAILAALPPGDARVAPYEQRALRWKEIAARSLADKALGQVIRLAADGLWLERAAGSSRGPSGTDVIERLKRIVRENS
jgi:AcrR family transcriptional regulator